MKKIVTVSLLLLGCQNTNAAPPLTAVPPVAAAPKKVASPVVAFPGAEGFGASTKGGRGGEVCIVTTLDASGVGSLHDCLQQKGPRTVVFEVSGVFEGPQEIPYGQLTIAGQSAPGPVVIKGGLICDNVYDPNQCNDVIFRHLRLRGGAPDSLRVGGATDVIIDHCSLENAEDENLEITRSKNVTVQNSIIAEPVGDHYKWGGLLLNYSKDKLPLDNISIHHNMWNGVSGRLPEISCEENDDGPGKSNCSGHLLHLELTNNLLWDIYDPIWYNRCTKNNDGNGCEISKDNFFVALNAVNNLAFWRSTSPAESILIEPNIFAPTQNLLYFSGNATARGDSQTEYSPARSAKSRNDFPVITVTPTRDLVSEVTSSVGALPRDEMDARLVGYVKSGVDSRPAAWKDESGVFVGDAFSVKKMTASEKDSDRDGMPDSWESEHGLDPKKKDQNDTGLSNKTNNGVKSCTPGYTALECYLNSLL